MPLFTKKADEKPDHKNDNNNVPRVLPDKMQSGNMSPTSNKPQLVFRCSLADGSPVGLISGFANVKELYLKIADTFDIPVSEILFCTLNTHKVDMKKLLGGQIGLDDFIFAHRKGRPKEVSIVKKEESLGLTITDNGSGYSFIKRIRDGSIIHSMSSCISVGDHIERLGGTNCVGRRHHEVARLLKEIPLGATFTIRLVEPVKYGFNSLGPRTDPKRSKKGGYGSGKETLRFKADGKLAIEEKDDQMDVGIDYINDKLETYLGINDSELATQIWEQAEGMKNSLDFADAIDNSDLKEFGFSTDFIIELWGVITDVRDRKSVV